MSREDSTFCVIVSCQSQGQGWTYRDSFSLLNRITAKNLGWGWPPLLAVRSQDKFLTFSRLLFLSVSDRGHQDYMHIKHLP